MRRSGSKRRGEATEETLRCVFNHLSLQNVMPEGVILKPNMVLPGLTCPKQESVDEVAAVTVRCLLRVVAAAVPGIAFLSGGQSAELASARLNAMNVLARSPWAFLPWPLVFSFARAIQQPALETWQGKEARVAAAQDALRHRARGNRAALQGDYSAPWSGRDPCSEDAAKPCPTWSDRVVAFGQAYRQHGHSTDSTWRG